MNKLITRKTGLIFLFAFIATGVFGQVIKEVESKDSSIDNFFVVEPEGEI